MRSGRAAVSTLVSTGSGGGAATSGTLATCVGVAWWVLIHMAAPNPASPSASITKIVKRSIMLRSRQE